MYRSISTHVTTIQERLFSTINTVSENTCNVFGQV